MSLTGNFEKIGLKDIEPSELNVRSLKDAHKDLDSLKESMRRRGLIHPIVVVPTNGKFKIVVGQRRWLAAQELGWPTIPALILSPMKVHEGKIISALENLQRKDLTFKDEAETADYLYDTFKGDYKLVAKELGIKEDRALRLLAKRMVPKTVREKIDAGQITRKDAARAVLAAYPDEKKIIEIAQAMQKLTEDEKSRLVDIATEKPENTPSEWVRSAKKVPKMVEYRIVLLPKYATSLERAANERGEDPKETARIAIIDWLEAKGFA